MRLRGFLKAIGLLGSLGMYSCETPEPLADSREPIVQDSKPIDHSNAKASQVSPMLREMGPQTMVLAPIPCPLGGAPERPSTNSDLGNYNSIEFGVSSIKEEHGTRRYLPYIQQRCK
jgi:hypothetical protein